MKPTFFIVAFAAAMLLAGACSQEPLPKTDAPVTDVPVAVEPAPAPDLPPVTLAEVGPPPPPPEPARVPRISPPPIQAPKTTGDDRGLAGAQMNAQYNKYDRFAPISNGSFERWEVEGPVEWHGEFVYKKPGDDPEAMDVQMYPDTLDGNWGLRLMPTDTDLEIWQDVTVEIGPGPFRLYCTAYVRNPVPEGLAFRVTYRTPAGPQVAEVPPVQTDEGWTRYHADIALPEDAGHESVRFYISRTPGAERSIIMDAVSVAVVGAPLPDEEEDAGPAAQQQMPQTSPPV